MIISNLEYLIVNCCAMWYILVFQILTKHHEQCMQLWVLDDIDGLIDSLTKSRYTDTNTTYLVICHYELYDCVNRCLMRELSPGLGILSVIRTSLVILAPVF